MKKYLLLFAGQMLNHLIWYASMRAAVAQNVRLTILLDGSYSLLLVFVLKKMETPRWPEWCALLLGGAVGTYAGLKITF